MNTFLHLGLIPDGNRRWAKRRGLKPWEGHLRGAEKIEKFIKWCLELGIKKVSIYVLSTENIEKRSKRELKELFNILENYLSRWERGEFDEIFKKYEVQVRFFGNYKKLPKSLIKLITSIMKKTAKYQKAVLNFLIGYGGTYEILNAIRKIVKMAKRKRIRITKKLVKENLWVNDDVDLIIRTGGFSRLSNFLPLQSTYAEIYVTNKLWPDFTKRDLIKALEWFNKRKRKFGR